MGSRTWIKLYCDKWLEGSIRQEKPALRGVWSDLLALCGGGNYSHLGEIKVRNGVGFTNKQLALVLNIMPKMLISCQKRLVETGRIGVDSNNIITIINWKTYQSEYERQKPQRTKSASKSAGIDVDCRTIDYRTIDIRTIADRAVEDTPTASFITYKEKLRTTFPELDIDVEWERCRIWYRDHKKTIKSPSLALGNWCRKEREIKQEKEIGKNAGVNRINPDDPDKYIKGKYGHMVQR